MKNFSNNSNCIISNGNITNSCINGHNVSIDPKYVWIDGKKFIKPERKPNQDGDSITEKHGKIYVNDVFIINDNIAIAERKKIKEECVSIFEYLKKKYKTNFLLALIANLLFTLLAFGITIGVFWLMISFNIFVSIGIFVFMVVFFFTLDDFFHLNIF